jgi:hypothetical protein
MRNGNASAVLPVPPLNNNMPSSVSSQKLPVGAHIVVQGDKERFSKNCKLQAQTSGKYEQEKRFYLQAYHCNTSTIRAQS